MSGSLVKPLFRVVANGLKDDKTVRLTVVATPRQSSEADAFELRNWPREVARGLREGKSPFPEGGLTLWFREIDSEPIPAIGKPRWKTAKMLPSRGAAYSSAADWDEINSLWQGALGASGASWAELAKDIADSLKGSKHTANLKESYSGATGARDQVDKQDEELAGKTLADDGSIAIKRPTSGDSLKISAILPVRQSDLAVEEETVRAARLLAKQFLGPFSVLDDRDGDTVAGTAVERFKAVIKATRAERSYSKSNYDKVKEALANDAADGTAQGGPTRPMLVPEASDVVAPENQTAIDGMSQRQQRRATQEYGAWLQRRPDLTGKKEGDRIAPPDITTGQAVDHTDDAPLQKMRGIYFALQGDPILSRLFGLAFDFEASIDEIVPAGGEIRLHLAVAAEAGASDPGQVATAAKLHNSGFWPVSVFDTKAAATENKQVHLIEQVDGIWRLGVSASGGPRYELASLDIRRSVDSKTLGRDRGEAHRTGGFTILDRGRSEQITRDIALADLNREKLSTNAPVVVLHAEELTIGRRVDVAVARPGELLANIQWRSLMNRFVDFDFGTNDKSVEFVLRALLGAKTTEKGILEETSFQTASRFVPKKGEGDAASEFEAVAEEAIFLWDGTPVSVLTDSGLGTNSISSSLPFDRLLDLPGADPAEAGLRPPPLRFGVPYLFRFRSMFLGGGSPPLSMRSGRGAVLPAEKEVGGSLATAPRRYLRHESISAPILLLPRHLAELRRGQMGYELADQAIVRSWNDEDSKLAAFHVPDEIKGEYVGKNIRASPSETIRVFVAPEAPHDLVSAHGRLDNPNAAEIRKGGLRDISYTPRQNDGNAASLDDGTERPSGFPVAVSTRRDALDNEGVIYPRSVFSLDKNPPRGIPVFEPGGKNTTQIGQVGYLPDPAIVEYSIRAKIKGSDRYLTGARAVALYQSISYPHALPLVVKVVRVASIRHSAPVSIDDISSKPVVTFMDDAGNVPAKTPKRARVQFLLVSLYQGEDFDLEISCLPDAEILASRFSVIETMAVQLLSAAADKEARERLVEICGKSVLNACMSGGADQLTGVGGNQVPNATYRNNVANGLLDAIKTKWPVEELAAVTTLRVHHALNKPPAKSIGWLSDSKSTRSIRTRHASVCGPTPGGENNWDERDATELMIDGKVQVDLDLVESFQVIATTIAANGFQVDSPDRGRSMISKRSGRWPVVTRSDGSEAYVAPADVVGFAVAEDGAVTLPREPVTLLAVGNLPMTKAIDPILPVRVAANPECTPYVFRTPAEGRVTEVSLKPLFAAAIAEVPIEQSIGMPADGEDRTHRKRRLQIQRPHVFNDTLARKLTLNLVAVSRGAAAFETAPTYVQGQEQTLFRRQPLKRIDQAIRASTPVEIWMNSTKAPSSPDARRPEPSFFFSRWATRVEGSRAVRYVVERHALARIYLGRGWFSSGEGERLAIVLWPPSYNQLDWKELDKNLVRAGGRTMGLTDFEDRDLGAAGGYVTRWGGDPIRLDKNVQDGNFIPPDAFADVPRSQNPAEAMTNGEGDPAEVNAQTNPHDPKFVGEALMPIPKAAPPKMDGEPGNDKPSNNMRDFLPVSLLTYEPCFDLDREEWYVDVALKANRASEPFVRFGLVRYQEHSISPDLATSEPVTVHMQLLPKRRVSVHVEPRDKTNPLPSGKKITVEVAGRGSRGIKEFDFSALPPDTAERQAAWKKNFDRLRLPKIRATVFHERGEATNRIRKPISPLGWHPAYPEQDLPLEMPEPDVDGDPDLVWKQTFELPQSILSDLGEGQVVIYLEEIDLRMPAAYREEPITFDRMFDEETFVASGPRFSARVPFLELL
ncbi:hypothetical protein [Sinorhizobium meliloti]|uniref:hypothetical protein n=1 Tax=Rhizobium meliloti TaxID=382 RepID=UPI003D9FD79B